MLKRIPYTMKTPAYAMTDINNGEVIRYTDTEAVQHLLEHDMRETPQDLSAVERARSASHPSVPPA